MVVAMRSGWLCWGALIIVLGVACDAGDGPARMGAGGESGAPGPASGDASEGDPEADDDDLDAPDDPDDPDDPNDPPDTDGDGGDAGEETGGDDTGGDDNGGEPLAIPPDCPTTVATGTEVGQVPPNVELLDAQGQPHQLWDHCGEAILLVAAAHW